MTHVAAVKAAAPIKTNTSGLMELKVPPEIPEQVTQAVTEVKEQREGKPEQQGQPNP